jgi:phenylacetic acid degradation operon negative regulatory protein
VHARSALFDLYGDHLLARGGRAPVSALIRMLQPLGITPAAVRTAVSRMVAQDWLTPLDEEGGPGYAVTPRARERLDGAAARIYRTAARPWDRTWHLRVLPAVPDRARRERIRRQLRFLGLAPLGDDTWISPWPAAEADRLLAEEGLVAVALTSVDAGPVDALLAAYDLDALGAAYDTWHREARAVVARAPADADDRTAFEVRSQLLHSWRLFLFRDPGLPADLLTPQWPGLAAAQYFDEHAARLMPSASRFVDRSLNPSGEKP